MRRSLIAVAGVVALAASLTGAWAFASGTDDGGGKAEGPTADQLREAVNGCDTQLSNGEYAEDADGSGSIPVCKSAGGAVHWKSDFDIDCDGQRTDECNENTDPSWQNETAFPQSDGQPLNSATLPHIVVPLPSDKWDYKGEGIEGGTVAAVTYEDKVVYAVVGDLGPKPIIGEGSYALAEALGIDPDPATGGVSGKVVDFILFPGVKATPIEDPAQSESLGSEAANKLVGGCAGYGFKAYPDLATGSKGSEVRAAQCLLADAGFPTGDKPSGSFDDKTVTATKEFQTKVGLEASGKVDKHTWTALLSMGETPELKEGSSGADVSRVQRALTAALGAEVSQDGQFGPKTKQAVTDYQTAAGVEANGVVNAETWKALQAGK
ncbi:peptidoglycan-binding protein [Stackebrandtia nassauensis]|uniref:Peptidoglycan-binding domain 1 protein n=1 Tax=Stackebrandtia nassauensis (strain DSM 44728 / CIP 108903 / NRRL B-16338 / NBRC 102104 / LLR-40K-21) TaxID=446470 RepID=D3PYG1_STANL|nr:peptidoglycan-binding protein [Stackebrandtia nassauensis]ADD41528.1 Peptidoglycan-binding domain 1 protein [Stackebrandtia nassauensis DSM 44728]